MNNLIFCNATLRPKCLLKTNLCCLYCKKYSECVKINEKIKPCNNSLFDDDDENCEFLI